MCTFMFFIHLSIFKKKKSIQFSVQNNVCILFLHVPLQNQMQSEHFFFPTGIYFCVWIILICECVILHEPQLESSALLCISLLGKYHVIYPALIGNCAVLCCLYTWLNIIFWSHLKRCFTWRSEVDFWRWYIFLSDAAMSHTSSMDL